MSDPAIEVKPYKRHIFVCTGPRCAPETSPALYQHLKTRLKQAAWNKGSESIQRSQCHCFGICSGGPLAVVYPEGVWYDHLDVPKMDRIIDEHLASGKPVEEYILYRNEK
jgi:(2Fe-2S) ferredoxin